MIEVKQPSTLDKRIAERDAIEARIKSLIDQSNQYYDHYINNANQSRSLDSLQEAFSAIVSAEKLAGDYEHAQLRIEEELGPKWIPVSPELARSVYNNFGSQLPLIQIWTTAKRALYELAIWLGAFLLSALFALNQPINLGSHSPQLTPPILFVIFVFRCYSKKGIINLFLFSRLQRIISRAKL